MHFCTYLLVALMLWLASGCSEPLDDTACNRNEDCAEGYACGPDGVCAEAPKLQVVPKTLVDAFIGEAYSELIRATGGIGDYTFSLSLDAPGESRLGWMEIVPGTGEIRNKAGEFPTEMGTGLGITVTVKDESNRGNGQEASYGFELDILECRGDKTCWEYGEEQGLWGCRQGIEACVDGALSGQCVLSGWSTSTEHCGDGCGVCDVQKADRCVEGNCNCGQAGGPCPADRTCCSGACTDLDDLNHCGACDTPCQPQHVASASCNQGACTYDQCQAGYYDCDANRANGCETARGLDNCSDCGDACTDQALYPNTTGHSCPAGVCEYQCIQGYADCGAGQAGCDTILGTLENCSDCYDACDGSAAGGRICIDDGGTWRCGCASEADCDGDDMCCTQICTPHDEDYCEDCDTGCTIATGGPVCTPVGGGAYECRCATHDDCKGDYEFSMASCSPSTHKCFCQGSVNCAGTVDDMCCIVNAVYECVDLAAQDDNCGMCGVVCPGSETCTTGACSCAVDGCPDPSGAPDCVNDVCVCSWYTPAPCPAGQHCCKRTGADQPQGCCLADCDTTISGGNSCSTDCGAPKVWCRSGCCDSCDPDTDCD
jgi:hypothetical protein